MRFDINLATRRYEDAGRFYRTWVPILVLAALLTVTLSAYAFHSYRVNSTTSREISKIDNRLSELEKQRKDAEELLSLPQNSGTRDTTQYLNDAFRLKSFSWTQVLNDLERLVPSGVQVVSIKPVVVGNQVQVAMEVETTDRARVLELVRRMEGSPRFPEVQIQNERSPSEGKIVSQIQALYSPVGAQ